MDTLLKSFYWIIGLLFCPTLVIAQGGNAVYHLRLPDGNYKNALLTFNDSLSLYTINKTGLDPQNHLDSAGFSVRQANGAISGIAIRSSPYDEKGEQVFRNFNRKKIVFRKIRQSPLPAYIVRDDWVVIDWEIENKFRDIAGFHCQKATGKFRGRTYKVWFTTEIPVPYGPWKLFGLPGLIVKAKASGNLFDMELAAIHYPAEDTTIAICAPQEPVHKTIREYVYYHDHLLDFLLAEMQEKLPPGMSVGQRHYNNTLLEERNASLERLYEWERKIPVRKLELPPDSLSRLHVQKN